MRTTRYGLLCRGAAILVAASPLLIGAAPQPAAAKSRVVIGITETLTSYNPHADSATMGNALWCQVYGCLGLWDFEKAEFVGMLAESWETKDPNTWVFHLRKGMMRHDGKAELTSTDVVHSINRTRTDPNSSQTHRVKKIKAVVAVDKYTVKMTTHEPTSTLLSIIFGRVMITSKELFDNHGAREADRKYHFGFGPYKLKELLIGQRVVIEKNTSWQGIKDNNPDEIIFRIMKEPEQRVTALLNGEIQIAQFIPPHLISRVKSASNARVVEAGSVEAMFLAMNPKFKPWENKKLRQAVSYAIDREAIIKAVLKGQATKLDGPIGPQQFGYSKNMSPKYTYDPDKARALVKEAGYPNGVEVELYTPVNRYVNDKQAAEAMIPMLNAVGIKATLKTPEWATLWSSVRKGNAAFYMMGRGGMIDPAEAISQYFETGIAPRISYSNKTLDALLQRDRATFDIEERKRNINQVINLLLEEAPAHFLWHQKLQFGVAHGVNINIRPDHSIYGWEITVDK